MEFTLPKGVADLKPRTTLVRVKMRMRLTDGNVFTVAIALLAGIVLASMRTDAALLEPAPGDHEESMKFGGYDRTFQVHVPPPRLDGSSKLPVVMMLHGAGGSAKGAARDTGWSIEADKDGFLAVYPEALPGRTRGCPSDGLARRATS